MPARPTASATISFGLVSIPVKLYSATQSKAVHFNLLHPKDHARVKQQYVSSNTGEVVERSELVKGYEHSRGQYVILSDEELEALEQKSDRSIEIEEFVPIEAVDPVYFDRANWLGPDKGGQKAYRLLGESMTRTGRVAIGRFSTRGRRQLVLIRPVQQGLMLHGLFYADEVRSQGEIELGDEVALKAPELALASQLIEQLSSPRFDPARYEDDYRRAVLEAVERKVAGQEIVAAPAEETRETIIDLVAALKRSLEGKRGAPAASPARERKPAKAKGRPAAARKKSNSRP